MRFEQPFGEVKGDGARADFIQHRGADLDALADDALHQHGAGADILGVEDEIGVVREPRRQPLFGELGAIALDARKRDFKMRPFLDRLDARDGLWRDDGWQPPASL